MVTSSQFQEVRLHVTALLWGADECRRPRCRSSDQDGMNQREHGVVVAMTREQGESERQDHAVTPQGCFC